jgi:hypothetical protein
MEKNALGQILKPIFTRVPETLFWQVKKLAELEGTSCNQYVTDLLRRAVTQAVASGELVLEECVPKAGTVEKTCDFCNTVITDVEGYAFRDGRAACFGCVVRLTHT